MQEYTQSGGVRPFGCCVFQNLERRYKDGLSIGCTEKRIEIAKFSVN